MHWLTAVLAFATTMLFYAIVVSTLVELIHRFLGLREKGLQLMLESLYSRVVKPKLAKAEVDSDLTATAFAEIIMANRALVGSGDRDVNLTTARKAFNDAKKALDAQPLDPNAKDAFKKAEQALHNAVTKNEQASDGIASAFLKRFLRPHRMNHVPVEIFTQKLADSRIVKSADQALAGMLDDIAQKYVAFGDESSEYFRRRARLLSVLLAFPVAFFFYVHPYNLAQTFIRDPELARAVAESDVYKAYEAQRRQAVVEGRQDGTSTEPAPNEGAGLTPPPGSEPAAPDASAAQIGEPNPDAVRIAAQEAEIEALKQTVTELQDRLTLWNQLNIPVGWPPKDLLKACGSDDSSLLGCRLEFFSGFSLTLPDLAQVFWLIVGALLVGLGAPFWAQAVSALVASRAGLDKIAAIVGGDDRGQAAHASLAVPRSAPQAPTARKTFEVARGAATTRTSPVNETIG